MDDSPNSTEFIEEWLNHFGLPYAKNVEINSNTTLTYYSGIHRLGILVIDWKKPISVQIANKALQIERELNLDHLFLISNEISQPAKKALQKFGKNIRPMHPNGLSDLAVYLTTIGHSNETTVKI